jgi:hypothetical protein
MGWHSGEALGGLLGLVQQTLGTASVLQLGDAS